MNAAQAQSNSTTHRFQAEVTRVLSLVINSLYSNKEIFLRELVSNASDALDKLRFRALTDAALYGDDSSLKIRLIPDVAAGTLTIWDNGIGMSHDELVQSLGTVAYSGSQAFLSQLDEAQKKGNLDLIGQFGVGFYSSYLVADRVEVISRAAGSGEAWRWFSDGREEFQLEPSEREVRGTSVILHLREEQRDYLDEWRIRELVSRYADYVDHTIELAVQRRPERDASTDSASADSASGETSAADAADDAAVGDETHDAALQTRFETINEGSALWVRGPSEITKEQYHEFYKHLTHDWDEPLAQIHFKIEGTTEFTGILFVPKTRPFDLFDRESHHGIRLYVKRVFIMEDCKEVLPRFLRFMRGMVDSNDLPLNISRELLQDSGLIRVIRKQVVKKALTLIEELASERPDDYATFFENFGPVLKEGVYSEAEHRERLAKLLRFDSSTEEKPTSLADYLTRMKEGQPGIYYALGMSRGMLESSPHLEVLKKKGYEILYLTDHIDQWVSSSLHEFEGKPLVNALAADLKLDENDSEAKAEVEAKTETLRSVIERFKSVLADRVAEVKVSERLDDSPVCLVIPPGGMAAHIERMLRLHKQKLPQTKRILELNPNHGLIKHLQSLLDKDGGTGLLDEWIELLFDQALLTEGSPLENPAAFAGRVTRLMERAAFAEVLRV